MGGVESRAFRVLQQIPERPCYIATRIGRQTAINGPWAVATFHATARNLGGRIRRRRWTALNGPVRPRFESGEGH